MNDEPKRCHWANTDDDLYVRYHDEEWGRPQHDDVHLFEMLILEGFQAGLSWACILHKRAAFREAYRGFDPQVVAQMDERDEQRLRQDKGIVRNRLKIHSSIVNARIFIDIQHEWGSFDRYIWHFTKGATVHESYAERTTSPLSDAISADLRHRGMKFVGSTIIYSYLQAIGIINAHGRECFLCEK